MEVDPVCSATRSNDIRLSPPRVRVVAGFVCRWCLASNIRRQLRRCALYLSFQQQSTETL